MAWAFGDGFSCYAAPADAVNGYWDGGTFGFTLVAGRFAGTQAIQTAASATAWLMKNSGANEAVHHLTVAYRQTAGISGATVGLYLQFMDGATGQCCITFRSDGVILLTSGTPAGTILATYSGAVTSPNTWHSFEFEVIISNTVGRLRVRRNGNTSDDFDSGAVLNTRPGANTYANRLQVGANNSSVTGAAFADLYWRSDASSLPWFGDIKCMARAPASDASVQFSRTPTNAQVTIAASTSGSEPTTTARYTPFTASYSGTITTLAVSVNTGFTGNMKCSLFADLAGNPGAVLGSATTLVNPVAGANTFTFGTPVAVVKGAQYWFGVSHDVTITQSFGAGGTLGRTSTAVTYAAFPVASPSVSTGTPGAGTVNIGPAFNYETVAEAQQDATTSYVYDSVVGHSDLYGIAPIASTPLTTYAVTTRAYAIKSDAGTRTMAVQLKSGSSTVASPTVVLTPSNWQWAWRTDTTDPATGAAWTAAAVNVAQVGPVVIA